MRYIYNYEIAENAENAATVTITQHKNAQNETKEILPFGYGGNNCLQSFPYVPIIPHHLILTFHRRTCASRVAFVRSFTR